MSAKHRLQDLTWREFDERRKDDPVIILPLGSQEEQGPQAPMGDFMLAEILALRIAERAGALAAPVIPFGYAEHFRPIAGGIALGPETFKAVLGDTLEALLDHGLNRILVFNGHTGNFPLIDQVVRRLKRERGVLIPCLNVWRLLTPEVWREVYGDDAPRAAGHGAEPLTSVAMHLVPHLMRPDLVGAERSTGTLLGLPTTELTGVRFAGVEVPLPVDVTDCCADGVTGGDPGLASPERGAKICEHIVSLTAGLVAHLKGADPTKTKGEVT